MSDIVHCLPSFDVTSYSHLFHSLEKNDITTTDLLTLDALEIARRCPLPLLEIRRLVKDVIQACQHDAGIPKQPSSTNIPPRKPWHQRPPAGIIPTLDETLDTALGGGIHTGYITEIAGESSSGKTQFVLGLLLSVQLPPPRGLGRSAIYISTEAPLATGRLKQMLASHLSYNNSKNNNGDDAALPPESRPSLDNVHTISVNDLEAQEHILDFQLPLAVQRFNAGLVVIDSVAANYRAEHSAATSAGWLADRAVELAKLGALLRRVASEFDIAVVVTNQVSDRFDDVSATAGAGGDFNAVAAGQATQGRSGRGTQQTHIDTIMSLDYQSRFFTGWGKERPPPRFPQREELKTPTLGLAWANQISARIVLRMEADRRIITTSQPDLASSMGLGGNTYNDKRKRRFMHVVFCPWAAETATEEGVEYEIQLQGIVSVKDETSELLDERLWVDGTADGEEEEYPF